MLTIRLFRVGRKNQPAFKIVVCDKRNAASRGRFVEEVGFYNPVTNQRNLKGDRVKYWMSVGAKASPTVHNMLVGEGILKEVKIPKHAKPKTKEETPQALAPEAPAAEPAKAQTQEASAQEKAPAQEPTPQPSPTPSPDVGEEPDLDGEPQKV